MKKLVLISLFLVSSFLVTSCNGDNNDDKKTDYVVLDAKTPSGKNYSFEEVDPREKGKSYTISNEEELIDFGNKINANDDDYLNGYFELSNDIKLTKEWTPAGGFKGQLNGNGHKISGIKVSSDKNKKGFFTYIDGAKIGNITFDGEINAKDTVGIVSGYSVGHSTFVGVIVEGKLNAANNIGGLVGSLSDGSVKAVGCVNRSIILGRSYVGGLIGANKTYKTNISDSSNCATVIGTGETIGGIIGSLTHSISEVNDYNLYECFNYGLVKGSGYVGGVVGLSSAQLIKCGVSSDAKVYQLNGDEEIEAVTLTSFNAPYCSVLSGNLLYNTAINEYGELIECQNQYGFAITGINDPAGCTRIIKFKDKLALFAATNKYAFSEDGGHTFGAFTTVSNKQTELCPIDNGESTDTGNTQPWVLEDGRIMMIYRSIRVSTNFSYSSLRMRISDTDGIFNSSDEPIMLIQNYTENTGKAGAFYEPYPILLEDGSYAIYISEDVHYSDGFDGKIYNDEHYYIPRLHNDLICAGNSQDTVMIPLKIAPLATEVGEGKIEVGEPVLIFQGSDTTMFGHTNSRPGMTVVTQLYDGSYAMTLENSTEQNNPGYDLVTQITYSRDGLTWTPPKTIIRPHQKGGSRNGNGKAFKCCAPFCTTLPDGRIVVVCATDEKYVGGFPNDDAHYKHEIAFVSKEKVGYGADLERDRDFIQLGNYMYSENEYCVWASVAQIDGRIYISGLEGVNYYKPDGTIASPTDWILISSINYLDLYKTLNITELK